MFYNFIVVMVDAFWTKLFKVYAGQLLLQHTTVIQQEKTSLEVNLEMG